MNPTALLAQHRQRVAALRDAEHHRGLCILCAESLPCADADRLDALVPAPVDVDAVLVAFVEASAENERMRTDTTEMIYRAIAALEVLAVEGVSHPVVGILHDEMVQFDTDRDAWRKERTNG